MLRNLFCFWKFLTTMSICPLMEIKIVVLKFRLSSATLNLGAIQAQAVGKKYARFLLRSCLDFHMQSYPLILWYIVLRLSLLDVHVCRGSNYYRSDYKFTFAWHVGGNSIICIVGACVVHCIFYSAVRYTVWYWAEEYICSSISPCFSPENGGLLIICLFAC